MKLDGPVPQVAPTLLGCVLRANGVGVRLTEGEHHRLHCEHGGGERRCTAQEEHCGEDDARQGGTEARASGVDLGTAHGQ